MARFLLTHVGIFVILSTGSGASLPDQTETCTDSFDEAGLLQVHTNPKGNVKTTITPCKKGKKAKTLGDSSPPDWFNKQVASITDAAALSDIFSSQGLWDSIQTWDLANPSSPYITENQTANQIMLAAFLGNVAQETGNLRYSVELAPPDYTTPCTIASGNCAADYGIYFGRGALQVTCWGGSYCANYKDVATVYGITDMETNPDQVATNPVLAWGSAVVFWMTNAGAGGVGPAAKWPSQKSFGGTYAAINGALECPPANTQGVNDPRVAHRIESFEKAAAANGLDVSSFVMTCPASTGGVCSGNPDWACKWDGDCGSSGVCNIAANAGVCALQDWKCFSDSDCGQSGPCNLPANKGSCTVGGADCWKDSDCASGTCSLPNLATCHGNAEWGCRKDSDCGQSGPCQVNPPGNGKCKNNPGWACWVSSECGSSDSCLLPYDGLCDKENWGCRQDSDCGQGGPCWVNPGPTGVPGVCEGNRAWACTSDFDCGQSKPCVAP
mmetsp:Transcript_57143/g.102695  ORF Transcript_57143/g.102695 Transcript_57143/m.102695 type:complete len:498 (-) Transcript_57143:170-1663(-)